MADWQLMSQKDVKSLDGIIIVHISVAMFMCIVPLNEMWYHKNICKKRAIFMLYNKKIFGVFFFFFHVSLSIFYFIYIFIYFGNIKRVLLTHITFKFSI